MHKWLGDDQHDAMTDAARSTVRSKAKDVSASAPEEQGRTEPSEQKLDEEGRAGALDGALGAADAEVG